MSMIAALFAAKVAMTCVPGDALLPEANLERARRFVEYGSKGNLAAMGSLVMDDAKLGNLDDDRVLLAGVLADADFSQRESRVVAAQASTNTVGLKVRTGGQDKLMMMQFRGGCISGIVVDGDVPHPPMDEWKIEVPARPPYSSIARQMTSGTKRIGAYASRFDDDVLVLLEVTYCSDQEPHFMKDVEVPTVDDLDREIQDIRARLTEMFSAASVECGITPEQTRHFLSGMEDAYADLIQ
jgi:hypothetical protein